MFLLVAILIFSGGVFRASSRFPVNLLPFFRNDPDGFPTGSVSSVLSVASEAIHVPLGAVWETLRNSGGKYSKMSNLLCSQKASLKSWSTIRLLHMLTVSPFVLLQVTTSCQTSTNHELVSVGTRFLVSIHTFGATFMKNSVAGAWRNMTSVIRPLWDGQLWDGRHSLLRILMCDGRLGQDAGEGSHMSAPLRSLVCSQKKVPSVFSLTSHGHFCHSPFNELLWEVRFPPRKAARSANCSHVFPRVDCFILSEGKKFTVHPF